MYGRGRRHRRTPFPLLPGRPPLTVQTDRLLPTGRPSSLITKARRRRCSAISSRRRRRRRRRSATAGGISGRFKVRSSRSSRTVADVALRRRPVAYAAGSGWIESGEFKSAPLSAASNFVTKLLGKDPRRATHHQGDHSCRHPFMHGVTSPHGKAAVAATPRSLARARQVARHDCHALLPYG